MPDPAELQKLLDFTSKAQGTADGAKDATVEVKATLEAAEAEIIRLRNELEAVTGSPSPAAGGPGDVAAQLAALIDAINTHVDDTDPKLDELESAVVETEGARASLQAFLDDPSKTS